MPPDAANLIGVAIDADGVRFPFQVTIGIPYLLQTEPDTWRCPVAIDPLHTHLPDIAGGDAFQSLCLASRLAVDLLHTFVQDGGRLTFDGENDVPLDAYIPATRRA